MRQHDNYGCPRLTSKRRVPADRPGTGDLGSFESRPQTCRDSAPCSCGRPRSGEFAASAWLSAAASLAMISSTIAGRCGDVGAAIPRGSPILR
jgi:hypothetical protein